VTHARSPRRRPSVPTCRQPVAARPRCRLLRP
jgi:hypothetical protein